jgi:hypothetical protein
MEVGLKHNLPFQYLDDFTPLVNWEEVHNDTVRGLAKAPWIKTAVSAGAHPDWAVTEMATYYKNVDKYLTPQQHTIFSKLETMEQKIKFLQMTTPTVHPFWLCFLRVNKAVERTQHENKAIAEQCIDTPNIVYFPKLMSVIRKLPMKSIGRILIFMTEANNETVPHYDASSQEQRERMGNADFIWFQPQALAGGPCKRIYVMDDDKNRYYADPSKQLVWFNEMDWHGTEPAPVFSYSVRVEGVFDDRVRPSAA